MSLDSLFDRGVRALLIVYCIILGMTAVAKIASLGGGQQILRANDLVWSIPIVYLLILATLSEMLVIGIIVYVKSYFVRFLAVNIISSIFILYKLGGYGEPQRHCPCLGTIGSHLGLDNSSINVLTTEFALFLFSSSFAVLMYLAKGQARKDLNPVSLGPSSDTSNLCKG